MAYPPSPKPQPKNAYESLGSSNGSGSAAAKRLAEEKATRKGKRTDKNNMSGFGMTRGGVEARAKSAGFALAEKMYPGGIFDADRYSGRITWMANQGTPKVNGNVISSEKAGKMLIAEENKVRKQYGVEPKNKRNPLG